MLLILGPSTIMLSKYKTLSKEEGHFLVNIKEEGQSVVKKKVSEQHYGIIFNHGIFIWQG